MSMRERPQSSKWYQSRLTWVLLGLIAVGGFFLVTEHTAHVLGVLPFLVFLLCPLMMLFMNGGHDGHGGPDNQNHEQPPEGGRQ
jgi:cell division protein FtsW (lipid II flippase)